jgi:glutathione-independent formaldehyde dehydrogenase
LGEGWSKAQSFHTGQTPTLRYNRALMQAIWHGRVNIAEIVNATVIPLEDAPKGYEAFDEGAASKFVLDPHGLLAAAA